jgi:hypothetical protein
MAAAVNAVSIFRLVSGPVDLSGKLALLGDTGPPDEAGLGTGASACVAGPIEATRCTETGGVGATLTGAFWRPTE